MNSYTLLSNDPEEIVLKEIDENGNFWVNKLPCPSFKLTDRDFIKTYHFSRQKPSKQYKFETITPVIGKRYAVLIKKYWSRCDVINKCNENYKVFLIDEGQNVTVSVDAFRKLPEKYANIPPLAYAIKLYGVNPVAMQLSDDCINLVTRKCKTWEPFHLKYIKDLIKEANRLFLKEMVKLNEEVYGVIFLKTYRDDIIVLNNKLSKEGLAASTQEIKGVDEVIKLLKENDKYNKSMKNKIKNSVELDSNGGYNTDSTNVSSVSDISGPLTCIGKEELLKMAFHKTDNMKHCDVTSSSDDIINYKISDLSSPRSNNSDELSDSSGRKLSNDAFYKCNRRLKLSENEKPMCSRVLMLYDGISKQREQNAVLNTSLESSRCENSKQIKSYSNKLAINSRIMLHQSQSILEMIKPIHRFIDSDITETIYQNLNRKKIRDLTPLQMYVLPILTKSYNLIMLSNSGSGKTLSCIISILSLISNSENYKDITSGYGPKAIFLTSFSKNVHYIEKYCNFLLGKASCTVVKSAYGGDAVERFKFYLAAGCDVLITTPRCLLRLLSSRFITNIERLCHIILDDGDFIFQNFIPEIQQIFALVSALENKRKPDKKYSKVQKVVLGECWTPVLEEFVKKVLKEGFICIPPNSLLEASIYSRIKPNIKFLKQENKIKVLIDFIKNEHGYMKTVIMASDANEAKILENRLDPHCSRLLVAHEDMDHIDVSYIRSAWIEEVEKVHAVIICTDDVLSELNVTNADNLIHYSLPYSKTCFSSRFGCLLENYNNTFHEEDSKGFCKVYLYVDEDNDDQLPEIVSFMERFRFPIPDKIKNVVMRINTHKESLKQNYMICENLKQFGYCWSNRKCHFRHIVLPEVDKVENFPRTGFVKFKLLYGHNASHYSVMLLEHKINEQWEKLPSKDIIIAISLKMDKYFGNKKNRRLHNSPNVGDLVAVNYEIKHFERARIIDIIKSDDKNRPIDVKVKLLEVGDELVKKVYDIYYLPKHLHEDPPQAVDVYLCRLQPADLDKYWSVASNQLISDKFKLAEIACSNEENNFLCGKIVLSIGRNLWFDPLTHSEWMESTGTEVYRSSFRHELIKANLAVDKPDHLELLYSICKTTGFKLPSIEKVPLQLDPKKSKAQWAHINRDEFTECCLVYAINPELLFLINPKFEENLERLEKEINKIKVLEKINIGGLNIGDLCLAVYKDNNLFHRAKIISFPTTVTVEVFYTDHGDFGTISWNDLAKIPDKFLKQLPMQAIECRLAGIQKVKENGYNENCIDLLYSLSELEPGIWKNLAVYVFDLELKAEITGGRKYIVAMIDFQKVPILLLNRQLIIEAEANWKMEEKVWLDEVCDKCIKWIETEERNKVADRSSEEEEEIWNDESADNSGVFRSSSNTSEEFPSSIIDEQLKQLYEVAQDMDNFSNPFTMLAELLNLSESEKNKYVKAVEELEKEDSQENPSLTGGVTACNGFSDLSELPMSKSITNNISQNIECKPSSTDKSLNKFCSKKKPTKIIKNKSSCYKNISSDNVSSSTNTCDNSDIYDSLPPLKLVGNCFSPETYWYQNDEFVWLHIKLIGIKKYHLKWTLRSLIFSTWIKDKYYRLDLNLFGPIYPELLKHSPKGFHVEIKMMKVASGSNWPRLLQPNVHYPWLKVNPDHIECLDSDEDLIEDGIRSKRYVKTDEYTDSDSSDTEDLQDFEEDPDDPHNQAVATD